MSDTSMGPGWWEASDGKWYPPRESDEAPAPGWWLAADGKWYPPADADTPPEPGWWLAADGKWYPPADADHEPEPEPEPKADAPEPQPAPVAAKPAPEPTPVASAAAATPAPAPRNGSNGSNGLAPPTDASEQIQRRNQASRDDAVTQFPSRFLAAARAVQLLESELALAGAEPAEHEPKKHERKGRARAEAMAAEAKAAGDGTAKAKPSAAAATNGAPVAEPVGDFATDPALAAVEPPAPPPEPPPEPPTVPVGRPTTRPGEEQGWPAPRPAQPAHPHGAPRVGEPGGPLIELRPSPLGADLDHLGDRLLVFEDRVELRDRGDHIRQAVAAPDIVDVGSAAQVHRSGADHRRSAMREPIVVKGLKPEQADEVARLVQTRLRHSDDAPTVRTPRPRRLMTRRRPMRHLRSRRWRLPRPTPWPTPPTAWPS